MAVGICSGTVSVPGYKVFRRTADRPVQVPEEVPAGEAGPANVSGEAEERFPLEDGSDSRAGCTVPGFFSTG